MNPESSKTVCELVAAIAALVAAFFWVAVAPTASRDVRGHRLRRHITEYADQQGDSTRRYLQRQGCRVRGSLGALHSLSLGDTAPVGTRLPGKRIEAGPTNESAA